MKVEYELDHELTKIPRNSFWNSIVEHENFEFGVMKLEPGIEDTQSPHKSDEVYFIISGDGELQIDKLEYVVKPNKMFYVPRGTPHKFKGNTQEIVAIYALGEVH